jgi:site-specific DNA recombinase
LTIVADPVERMVADAVIWRLDTPELADALAGRAASDEAMGVVAEHLSADRARLDELAQAYAAGSIEMREWMVARKPIEEATVPRNPSRRTRRPGRQR